MKPAQCIEIPIDSRHFSLYSLAPKVAAKPGAISANADFLKHLNVFIIESVLSSRIVSVDAAGLTIRALLNLRLTRNIRRMIG